MATDDIFARIHCNDTAGAVRALAETPALAAARHTGLGSTPLHCAAHRGQFDVIEALLAAGAEVEARETASDTTALHWAAEGGHAAVVEALLAAGADIAVRDAWYRLTPLGWSTLVDWAPHLRADRPAVIGVLLASGAEHDVFTAMALGRHDVVAALLAADPSTSGRRLGYVYHEMSPLHIAAARGDVASAQLLLDAGADLAARTVRGLTPLALARGDVGALLRQRGASDDVAMALLRGEVGALRAGLASTAPGQRTAVSQGLLFTAAASGFAAAIEPLVANGADVAASTRHLINEIPAALTPLMLAALGGHEATVRALLAIGAVADGGAASGLPTPLHVAAGGGFPGVVRALVDAGADQQARDATFGATPLGWAEHAGHDDIVALLRDSTAG